MANNVIKRVWNQNRMVAIEDLKGMTFQAESGGHTFQISGVDDAGNVIALSGSVAGVFLRPDNTDVAITGSASGGVVSVTLPANCYDVPGRFGLTVFVTSNGQKTAVYAAMGTVSRTSSGTVSPGTTSDVVDLINRINAAVATIPASWTGLMADIAPTYSDAAVYPVGAYVYYNGDLYRCTTAITTAESWTAGHWTQAVLGNDVSDLKSALNQVVSPEGLTITATAPASSKGADYTFYKGRKYSYTNNSSDICNLTLFKADGTQKRISSSIAVNQTIDFTCDDHYVRFSSYFAGTGNCVMNAADDGVFDLIGGIESKTETLEDNVSEIGNKVDGIITAGEIRTIPNRRPSTGDYTFFKGRKYKLIVDSSVGANVQLRLRRNDGTVDTLATNISSEYKFICSRDDYVGYSVYFGALSGFCTLQAEDEGIFALANSVKDTVDAMPDSLEIAKAAGVFWNICNPADFINGSVWLAGSVYNASGYYRTTVNVEPGKQYTLANGNGSFCWYEDDEGVRTKLTNGVFTVPANCHKLRLSTVSSLTLIVLNTDFTGTITPELFPYGEMKNKINPDDIIAQMKTVIPTYNFTTLSMFPTIAVIGDSFESGGIYINSQTGPYGAFYDYSWPTVLERRCGSVVNNYSSPGLSTRTWLTHETRGLPKALADAGSAIYMIFLGINDYGMENYLGTIADITSDYTQNPDTFYGNYARIIEQMQAHSPGAKFMLVVPPLITPDFANAIEAIAAHYSLPTFRSGADEFFHTDFYVNNKGTAHPVAMTYAGMALAYERLGSLCIQNNQQYFFDVH